MRFFALAAAAIALVQALEGMPETVVAAVMHHNFTNEPDCAIPCLEDIIPKSGCDLDDQGCQCDPERQKKMMGPMVRCLTSHCSPKDVIQAAAVGASLCSDYSKTATSGLPPSMAAKIAVTSVANGNASVSTEATATGSSANVSSTAEASTSHVTSSASSPSAGTVASTTGSTAIAATMVVGAGAAAAMILGAVGAF